MSPFRLCVDLNVWISYFLARRDGFEGASSRVIFDALKAGRCALGPIQLVIAHTMLTRLFDVLVEIDAPMEDAAAYIAQIAALSRLGPSREHPHVVLGGGVEPTRDAIMPLYDAYDPGTVPDRADVEDGRVLDTAVAGRADALVTYNIPDFISPGDRTLVAGDAYARRTAARQIIIVRPRFMADWLLTGQRPKKR